MKVKGRDMKNKSYLYKHKYSVFLHDQQNKFIFPVSQTCLPEVNTIS